MRTLRDGDVLKISSTQSSAGRTTLLLEGRLLGPWVAELQSAVKATGVPTELMQLNLSGVQFADAAGVRLLQRLSSQGIHLEGLSPFIRELLDSRLYRHPNLTSPIAEDSSSSVDHGENP